MPLIQSATDALPFIDVGPSEEALAAARALIDAESSQDTPRALHPSIPDAPEPKFSLLLQAELDRLETRQENEGGIDLTRYDALDAPAKGDVQNWRETLRRAYISAEYLRWREVNLALLETYGKNAWLVGNSQLEDLLKELEREIDTAKTELERVNQARMASQGNVAAEMQNLDETWRRGVGRMIEAQAAGEGLKQEILERRRHAVS